MDKKIKRIGGVLVRDVLHKQAKLECKDALKCLESWCDTGDVSYYDDAVSCRLRYDAIVQSAELLGHKIVDGGTAMPDFSKFIARHNRAVETGYYRPKYGLVEAR